MGYLLPCNLTIIYSLSKLIWDHPLNKFICTVCMYNARKDWFNVPEAPSRPIPLYQAKINQKTGRRLKFTTHTGFCPVIYIYIYIIYITGNNACCMQGTGYARAWLIPILGLFWPSIAGNGRVGATGTLNQSLRALYVHTVHINFIRG